MQKAITRFSKVLSVHSLAVSTRPSSPTRPIFFPYPLHPASPRSFNRYLRRCLFTLLGRHLEGSKTTQTSLHQTPQLHTSTNSPKSSTKVPYPMATPRHRLIPALSDENKYVADIIEMRRSIQGVETPEGQQIGAIRHALETLDNFGCSTSEWSNDHIVRFQAVCFVEQPASQMYPSRFLPRHDVKPSIESSSSYQPNKTSKMEIGNTTIATITSFLI